MNQVILFLLILNLLNIKQEISITGNTYNTGDGEEGYDAN